MPERWSAADVDHELERRVGACLAASDVIVDYYRIGYRFAFKLPVSERPSQLPDGVLGDHRRYPWLIWLGWELEERWRILGAASRHPTDGIRGQAGQAEQTLAAELEALSKWSSFDADANGAGLFTASMAAVCADLLQHSDQHGASVLSAAATVAERILTESVQPWYEATWRNRSAATLGPEDLHNIGCITLFRAAQLAAALQHRFAQTYQQKAAEVYAAWIAARPDPEPMTEAAAYDGFLLDSMLDWLDARPDAAQLRTDGAQVLAPIPLDWARLTQPGRPDILAPIGDVEPEMTQWASAAARICTWYEQQTAPAHGWLRAFPLRRLPGWTLGHAAAVADSMINSDQPATGTHQQPSTVTLRNGWSAADPVAVVAASRTPMGHLHADGGHLVLGWQRRWWITDPGYQQYRLGDERDFTIGREAHNAPVIADVAQSARETRVQLDDASPGRPVELDLGSCYPEVSSAAAISRKVWLLDNAVAVQDHLTGLPAGTRIDTHWNADTELAWSFLPEAVRLTDGTHALWMITGTPTGVEPWDPRGLARHPGTRGPLRLTHTATSDGRDTVRWWIFLLDGDGGWDLPDGQLDRTMQSIGGWAGGE